MKALTKAGCIFALFAAAPPKAVCSQTTQAASVATCHVPSIRGHQTVLLTVTAVMRLATSIIPQGRVLDLQMVELAQGRLQPQMVAAGVSIRDSSQPLQMDRRCKQRLGQESLHLSLNRLVLMSPLFGYLRRGLLFHLWELSPMSGKLARHKASGAYQREAGQQTRCSNADSYSIRSPSHLPLTPSCTGCCRS